MKSIFKSKTFWFNLLTGMAAFAEMGPPEAQPYLVPGLAIGNILLRTITVEPVKVLPK